VSNEAAVYGNRLLTKKVTGSDTWNVSSRTFPVHSSRPGLVIVLVGKLSQEENATTTTHVASSTRKYVSKCRNVKEKKIERSCVFVREKGGTAALRINASTFGRLIERRNLQNPFLKLLSGMISLRRNTRLVTRKRQIQRRIKWISLNKYSEPVKTIFHLQEFISLFSGIRLTSLRTFTTFSHSSRADSFTRFYFILHCQMNDTLEWTIIYDCERWRKRLKYTSEGRREMKP